MLLALDVGNDADISEVSHPRRLPSKHSLIETRLNLEVMELNQSKERPVLFASWLSKLKPC